MSWSASRHRRRRCSPTMKFITVNPTWNVAQSIIYNELLPLYELSDPNIFARMGLSVERKPNGEVRVFQPPGRAQCVRPHPVQFPEQIPRLPARHTGEALLRARQASLQPRLHARAGSDEIRRGAAVLRRAARQPRGAKPAEDVRRRGAPDRLRPAHPVHISYQTAFVDDNGKLVFRDDVYASTKA